MRISLLEKREPFYSILSDTLNQCSLFSSSGEKKQFYVNRYLNYIAAISLSKGVFTPLVREYSNVQGSELKGWLLKVYVQLAVTGLGRALFAQKKIKLSQALKSYLILGGNHRIRLFNSMKMESIIILKTGERDDFIKNDLEVRTKFNLTYAPKVKRSGENWIIESVSFGTPLNRISILALQKISREKIMVKHLNLLHKKSEKLTPVRNYYQQTLELVSNCFVNLPHLHNPLRKIVEQTLEKLFEEYKENHIKTAWTHGDFQDANILVNEGDMTVIDWESSAVRCWGYDAFVLYSGIRTGVSLKVAKENIRSNNEIPPHFKDWILANFNMVMVDEILFRLTEESGINYYSPFKGVLEICNNALALIDRS